MKGHHYTPEQIEFLTVNRNGRTRRELVDLFNKHFNLQMTYGSIDGTLYRNNITNSRRANFTKEHINFLSENVTGRSYKDLTDMFNIHFNKQFSLRKISHALNYYGLQNGLRCKGVIRDGELQNRPLGSERLDKSHNDNYVIIKIANPNIWVKKHVFIWETANGPVPENHVVIFGDGNRQNFDINNLLLVPRRLLSIINRYKLIGAHADVTKVGIALAEMIYTMNKIKRENKKRSSSNKKLEVLNDAI